MQTVYQASGGAAGMLRLAHAWHARVLADEVVEHAFSHGYPESADDVPDGLAVRHWSWDGPA